MTRDVKFYSPDTNLAAATEIMWRTDCGTLPVLDQEGKLVGVITDRDICIALGTRNWSASDVAVRDVAAKSVFSCGPEDDVHEALKVMHDHKIRRVPAVNEEGKLVGILCLNDIALRAERANHKTNAGISYDDVVNTMKAICEHRAPKAPEPATMAAGGAVTL
jgi:CBS domain-containing protein